MAQGKWYRCHKCQGMTFGGSSNLGVCSAPPRDRGDGFPVTAHHPVREREFELRFEGEAGGGQTGWRWCRKCFGLWFAGNLPAGAAGGCCPADTEMTTPQGHVQDGSGRYLVLVNVTAPAEHDPGWRWCRKCLGLWFGQDRAAGGDCPCDTYPRIRNNTPEQGHLREGSGNYAVRAYYVPP